MHFERTGLEDTKGAVMVGTEVVTATEHDRIVAELKSELARLGKALERIKRITERMHGDAMFSQICAIAGESLPAETSNKPLEWDRPATQDYDVDGT